MSKEEAFSDFIGSEPVENDAGWSLEVWNAAWEAATKEIIEMCKEGLWDAVGIQHHLEQRSKDWKEKYDRQQKELEKNT